MIHAPAPEGGGGQLLTAHAAGVERPRAPRRLRTLFVLASWLTPALAAAAATSAEELAAYRRSVIEQARGEGIPAEPLLVKITEGDAKGIPLERIRPVIDRMRGNLVAGSEACRGWSRARECTLTVADTLETGVQPSTVKAVLQGAAKPLDEAGRLRVLFALGDLATRGVPPRRAVALIEAALPKDGRPLSVSSLIGRIAEQAGDGEGPRAAKSGQGSKERGPHRGASSGAHPRGRLPHGDPARDREGSHRAISGRADEHGRAAEKERREPPTGANQQNENAPGHRDSRGPPGQAKKPNPKAPKDPPGHAD